VNRRDLLKLTGLIGTGWGDAAPSQAASGWRAGVASVDITPRTSLWMAGYARRDQPSQGVGLPLHAKALALESGGRRAVLLTMDLLGVTARLGHEVALEVQRRFGIPRESLLLNASHTHSGPVIDDQLSVAYDLSAAQRADIAAYSNRLAGTLVDLAGTALSRLAPADLACTAGEARFGANRRTQFTPDGPVDRSVPVLRVTRGADLVAIVFGYACHNTTLQHEMLRFHGDYAGVAQAALEARHRGATALFVAGCGADINPQPRGTLALVRAHGTSLADAVSGVLDAATPIPAGLATRYETVALPFAGEAERAAWKRQLAIDRVYLDRHTRLMEAAAARDGALPSAQQAPVQVWQFGGTLALVALSGEVVVDYALRIARDYPALRTWSAGYSNDVFGYLPSERVLREGGYEGADAMIYYGRPGPFAAGVEEAVHGAVRRLMVSSPPTG
jgi:neutral ceramidase